jgi:hypothetical protein
LDAIRVLRKIALTGVARQKPTQTGHARFLVVAKKPIRLVSAEIPKAYTLVGWPSNQADVAEHMDVEVLNAARLAFGPSFSVSNLDGLIRVELHVEEWPYMRT